MGAGAIDHPAENPTVIQRCNCIELVLPGATLVVKILRQRAIKIEHNQQGLSRLRNTRSDRVLYVTGRAEGQISSVRQWSNIEQHVASVNIDDTVRPRGSIVPNNRRECIPSASVRPEFC